MLQMVGVRVAAYADDQDMVDAWNQVINANTRAGNGDQENQEKHPNASHAVPPFAALLRGASSTLPDELRTGDPEQGEREQADAHAVKGKGAESAKRKIAHQKARAKIRGQARDQATNQGQQQRVAIQQQFSHFEYARRQNQRRRQEKG